MINRERLYQQNLKRQRRKRIFIQKFGNSRLRRYAYDMPLHKIKYHKWKFMWAKWQGCGCPICEQRWGLTLHLEYIDKQRHQNKHTTMCKILFEELEDYSLDSVGLI